MVKKILKKTLLTIIILIFAISFILPTVLTFTNSFMSEQEISSNYGVIFEMHTDDSDDDSNGSVNYHSELVNLKIVPDMAVGTQYETVLLKSPDYLMKFWNSVFLVVPIMIGQILLWARHTALCASEDE